MKALIAIALVMFTAVLRAEPTYWVNGVYMTAAEIAAKNAADASKPSQLSEADKAQLQKAMLYQAAGRCPWTYKGLSAYTGLPMMHFMDACDKEEARILALAKANSVLTIERK